MKNRLALETSPYLKQHEDNPVEWYAWGEEALALARSQGKPILLSVGYSACHWCHVMAHESFENAEIAGLMNEHFINIKVDREERPDLDQIYQNVAQAMTGGGGWPLTVFLTPDLRPFFGGTYFPPEDRYGRPGFGRLVKSLSEAYQTQSTAVQENAEKLTQIIREMEAEGKAPANNAFHAPSTDPFSELVSLESLEKAAEKILGWVDWKNGGVGNAPKFPNPMMFTFLWRISQSARARELAESARAAVLLTLSKMAKGGIYDQLGGGFSRYSVDGEWAVPHFEKMLYDNALLLKLYSETLLQGELDAETSALFLQVVDETVAYLAREMTSEAGAFYAAQDADSEGEEGKFFAWNPKEIGEVLDSEDARLFNLHFGIDEVGNFEHGKTVLSQAVSEREAASQIGCSVETARARLQSSKTRVFEARTKRIAPGLDSKVLTSWNGLMVSGLAFASLALEKWNRAERALQAAQMASRAYDHVAGAADAGDSRLFATLQAGRARFNAYLDDYAFLARGALDLARVFPERSQSLAQSAEKWVNRVLLHFKDDQFAGYFFTSDDHEKLLQRPKTVEDQAIPSGTAIVLEILQALSEIFPEKAETFESEWRTQLAALLPRALKNPYSQGELLNAAFLALQGAAAIEGKIGELDEGTLGDPRLFLKKETEAGKFQLCRRKSCEELESIVAVRERMKGV